MHLGWSWKSLNKPSILVMNKNPGEGGPFPANNVSGSCHLSDLGKRSGLHFRNKSKQTKYTEEEIKWCHQH